MKTFLKPLASSFKQYLPLLLVPALMAAGSMKSEGAIIRNRPPIAVPGNSANVFDKTNGATTVVTLDGTGSYDPDLGNTIVSYLWVQTSGPAVTLSGANTAHPTFPAPTLSNGVPVAVTFSLTVSDSALFNTNVNSVTITIVSSNQPPVARTVAPEQALEGTSVILDGSTSTDPDQDPLTYTWTQTGGPAVTIGANGTNINTTDFTLNINAPHSVAGQTVSFNLTVSDGLASNTTSTSIFVENGNDAPVVTVSPDDSILDITRGYVLSGSATDPNNDPITSYTWVQIAGPAATIVSPNSPTTVIIPPALTSPQTLTFKLVASDAIVGGSDALALTGESIVNILVTHANKPPVADAGPGFVVPAATLVTLNGTNSTDPENDPLGYTWVQTDGPRVLLLGANTAYPTFIAPWVRRGGDTVTFSLVVKDTPISGPRLTSDTSSVTVGISYFNNPPTVPPISTQTLPEGSLVTLSTTASDVDGQDLNYGWVQTSGPAVTLDFTNPAAPTFIAPEVGVSGAQIVFTLTVNDGYDSTTTTATVNVTNLNQAPVADAGNNFSINSGTVSNLDGRASSDPEGSTLSYSWVQVSGPAVTLVGANTAMPSFTAPAVAVNTGLVATFKLIVSDGSLLSTADLVDVVIYPAGIAIGSGGGGTVTGVNFPPTAVAGGSTSKPEGTRVVLNGLNSSDPEGQPLSYSWVQISGPAVVLTGATTATPSFTTPYVSNSTTAIVFSLVVTDPIGLLSRADLATITVLNSNTPPTTVNIVPSTTCLWPADHRLVTVSLLGAYDVDNNATITITSVTQDEPTAGTGVGDTEIDAFINGSTVQLRAERSDTGNGRVYYVHYSISDPEGTVTGVVKVFVPVTQCCGTVGQGGELFDSTKLSTPAPTYTYGCNGGLTLGYWHNKNGQCQIGADDLACLKNLNLCNTNGSNYDPCSKTDLGCWLTDSTATNMARMLSCQLATMQLNVINNCVKETRVVYAPSCGLRSTGLPAGYVCIKDLITAANTELGLHKTCTSSSSYRTYQNALKCALDDANNNRNWCTTTPR